MTSASTSAAVGPAVKVACCALRRTQSREQYVAHDYQVCLLDRRLPRGRVEAGLEPEEAALRTVRDHSGLKGNAAVQLAVHGRPSSVGPHTVTILYVVPVSSSGQATQFHSLQTAMDHHTTHQQDREMLTVVSEWLQERHALPFLDLSMLFLGLGGEGRNEGGEVKTVIQNPVFSCHIAPPEDKLVISLNNPTFPTGHSTLDLHATHA